MLKLQCLYLSYNGDLKDIETYSFEKSPKILQLIPGCLITRKINIICQTHEKKSNKSNIQANNELKESNVKDIESLTQTQEKLINLQDYYSNIFRQNKDLRALQILEKKMEYIGKETEGKISDRPQNQFLGKKKKRHSKKENKENINSYQKYNGEEKNNKKLSIVIENSLNGIKTSSKQYKNLKV